MSYEDPVEQQSMVTDDYRNGFYRRAMEACVGPETVVLDLGAGMGILGLLAARLGAKKVYLVEPEGVVLEVARQIAEANGLADRIEFISGRIEEVTLPEKVDVILSVFTGNFLLEEDLLPLLFLARDEHLKVDGTLIPDYGRMFVAPVEIDDYYAKQIARWEEEIQDLDHSVVKKFAVNKLYYDRFKDIPHRYLGETRQLTELDFQKATSAECISDIEVEFSEPGTLHGFLGWFDMRCGQEWLSTSPEEEPTHWSQVFLPVEPIQRVEAGSKAGFSMKRTEFGEWNWRLESECGTSTHSTFLSRPFRSQDLSKRSEKHQPVLSAKGRVAMKLMSTFDGNTSAEAFADWLQGCEPDLFPDRSSAMRFVQQQIERFSE